MLELITPLNLIFSLSIKHTLLQCQTPDRTDKLRSQEDPKLNISKLCRQCAVSIPVVPILLATPPKLPYGCSITASGDAI